MASTQGIKHSTVSGKLPALERVKQQEIPGKARDDAPSETLQLEVAHV